MDQHHRVRNKTNFPGDGTSLENFTSLSNLVEIVEVEGDGIADIQQISVVGQDANINGVSGIESLSSSRLSKSVVP